MCKVEFSSKEALLEASTLQLQNPGCIVKRVDKVELDELHHDGQNDQVDYYIAGLFLFKMVFQTSSGVLKKIHFCSEESEQSNTLIFKSLGTVPNPQHLIQV
jgi:hypothetical protein